MFNWWGARRETGDGVADAASNAPATDFSEAYDGSNGFGGAANLPFAEMVEEARSEVSRDEAPDAPNVAPPEPPRNPLGSAHMPEPLMGDPATLPPIDLPEFLSE